MLSVDTHPKIPSNKKFHLILFMRKNGNITNFKEQNIYKCNASFKRAMKDLHDRKVVLMKQMRTGNQYKLTHLGLVLGGILDELAK